MPSGVPIALPPASTSPRTSNSRLPLARSTRDSPPSVVQGWPPPPMPPTTLAACSMPTMVFQRTLLPPSAAAEPASAVASNALAATLANAAGAQILPFVAMAVRAEEQKNEAVEAVAALATRRLGDGRAAAVARFVRRFYSHVPPEDILDRAPEDLYGAALSLWRFAETRQPGRARLRVIDPRVAEEGWRSPRTIVEIVNDDMPFLVDSVTAALAGEGFAVNLVIHPILRVERDAEGRLAALRDDAAGNGDGAGLRESFMHVEISAESGGARLDALTAALERVLGEVRAAVTGWAAMRARIQRVIADLAEEPPPLAEAERKEAADFLAWLDDANFTFLGFREYRFGAGEGSLDIVPGSGLGILSDDSYPVFDGLRNFATLPPDVRQFLREPRLLLITKSNRRARVHRPVHMDAICIKSFDAAGRAVGERLVVGLFTSLAYSRSPRAIPLLRRKVERTLERAGFDPASHDGKALLHIL